MIIYYLKINIFFCLYFSFLIGSFNWTSITSTLNPTDIFIKDEYVYVGTNGGLLILNQNLDNVVELNSSDIRTAKHLKKFKLLAETDSPFTKNLILIDDIEVSQDQGFIKFVGEILQSTQNPIILTCADKYDGTSW